MSTVMIVDDSKTSRYMLRSILVQNGYEVIAEAENGQEGYDKYCELNPDFVTLDITMPVMDGLEALEEIMKFDKKAKVVMITAAGQQVKVIQALKIGAEKFVVKPFDKEKVRRTLEEMVK